ncbi:solute carrier family 41 member 3 isoform X2 [Pteronotus mesoamericanus]|uniref:solute carrier family 41 member 3 isoform X2 n=1 Tax=Pteronotus mesoamericanus TaxID=1884717 RepID=UPI0023EE0D25|nr:solute carrier family 41 member 3 isoform X2 [Pteronotus parnellii mesoamericanus]
MDGTKTRQRRPGELGLPYTLSPGRLPAASEDGSLSVPESQRVATKSLSPELSRETALSIGFQVTVPFMFAGLGLSGAGILLNYFQHWPVFVEVKDLLTLVPPLVGLKGNLEMTLASRLSTAVQATIVGLLAAMAALLLGAVSSGELDFATVKLLCASSVSTSFLAAFALGVLMVCIVIGAQKLGVNPDNIATPIAASLGDLITLSILAFISNFFYKNKDNRFLTPLVCIGFMALTPVWVLIAKQNPPIMKILKFGWFPIILAMVFSSFGGLILNKTISKEQYKGMAIFTPMICGVGGNLVAIQTSRISTYLHMWSTPGVLPLWMKKFWPNPCSTFCTSEINSVSARVLIFLVIPGHLIFFYVTYLVEGHSVPNSKIFVAFYLLAGLIQVTILLYLAEVMARLTWHQALDPDNHCIPYLTGLGDLLGTGLLALCFLISSLLQSEAELDSISKSASGSS